MAARDGLEIAAIEIVPDDPRRPEIAALIAALDEAMRALYPVESCHFLTPDQLVAKGAVFLAARRDDAAVGCVAFVPDGEGTAEVKRVWTAPEARGQGVGRALLERLIAEARTRGLSVLRLETGPLQPEAIGLFRTLGFAERGPFGCYTDDPNLVFMEKILDAESAA
jgi:putative acetyltransferase